MIALDYTTATVDAAAAACGPVQLHSAWERERPSISGTPSCRGCDDPQCGYCEEIIERTHEEIVDEQRERIIRSDRELIDMLRDVIDERGHELAQVVRLHIQGDDLAAGDVVRDLFVRHIDEVAEFAARRAA